MNRFLDEQIGKVVLVLALSWVAASAVVCPERRTALDVEGAVKGCEQKVQVPFNPQELAPREEVFPGRSEYRGSKRFVFGAKVSEMEPYRALDLAPITRAGVAVAPQLLIAPGPSLQGADKLARWGQDLPPITVPQASDLKKR